VTSPLTSNRGGTGREGGWGNWGRNKSGALFQEGGGCYKGGGGKTFLLRRAGL